jgi:hypothetical protein
MAARRQTGTVAKAPKPRRASTSRSSEEAERKIDEASEHSMDASDPPSYGHGSVGAGRDRLSTDDDEDSDLEHRIRRRAHQLWLDEGCPEGRATEHWRRAKELIATEDRNRRE